MMTRMKPPRATLLAIGTLIFLSVCPDLRAAGAPEACKIEGFDAECHYDSSGVPAFWIFNVRVSDGSQRATAITGYPQLLKMQKGYGADFAASMKYSKPPFDFTVRELLRQVELIGLIVRNSQSSNYDANLPSMITNRKFIDEFLAKQDRISPFLPFPLTRGHFNDWTKKNELDDMTLNDKLQAQFDPWRIKSQVWSEYGYFPSSVKSMYPGAMNLSTMRIPLFTSSHELLHAWSAFWLDCWQATPRGTESTGCKADFSDFVRGAAVSKATAQSYPNAGLAARAKSIGAAIDAARRYHEATLELLPHLDTAKWMAAGVESDHLEVDYLPPATLGRIQAADVELEAALDEVRQGMGNR